MAPNMPMQLRYTPNDDRGFSATPFWRKKWEVGQAAGFGFGDRPTYGKSEKDGSVAPNNYGDISKQVCKTRNNVCRAGITMHPKFPSNEERYRDLSWPQSGPGPGKYDTRIPAGQGSWFNPVPNPSFSMQSRPILDQEMRAGMGRPGAGDYETRIDPGRNAPHLHGTLYDIKCRGRLTYTDAEGGISPGPARYNHKEGFDSKGLLQKILNVPIPPRQHRRTSLPSMPVPEGEEEDEDPEAEDYQGRSMGQRSRSSPGGQNKSRKVKTNSTRRKMQRVESSPADLARSVP